jgi:hypothetical protein
MCEVNNPDKRISFRNPRREVSKTLQSIVLRLRQMFVHSLLMNRVFSKLAVASFLLSLCLPIDRAAEPTNGPLVALGVTNIPIGSAALEIIEGGVLFVHNTEGGSGVSVQLGEADSGIFLYPLTGYLYEGDTMEAKAYGRVNGTNEQFVSSVRGVHNGDSSGTVRIDLSALGASRVSVFVNNVFWAQINNPIVDLVVRGDGNGCRANPWWVLPNGRFGALIEMAYGAEISVPAALNDQSTAGSFIFISPDDPTNSVEFVSRVDATAFSIGSFCLTDAHLGMFHQRHKAIGATTLDARAGQLVVGNVGSFADSGLFVQLAGISAFDMSLLPVELTETNDAIVINAYGSSHTITGSALGTLAVGNLGGVVRITVETGLSDNMKIQVRSNGVVVGSTTVSSAAAIVDLSGAPGITGFSLLAKTMDTLPGFVVRVDESTTFNVSNGQGFVGDEVRLLAEEPAVFESIDSFVMKTVRIPSVTITNESTLALAPPPELTIARSTNGVILSWRDPNLIYFLEGATDLAYGFVPLDVYPTVEDNVCRVTVTIEGTDYQFFRLQRRMPNSD